MRSEFFHGLTFWDAHGDGTPVLEARTLAGEGSLIHRFEFFSPEFLEFGLTFALSDDDGRIVGLAGCTLPDEAGSSIGLAYVSVDPSMRGRRFASVLCTDIARYMQEHAIRTLQCSGYTSSGHERLRHVFQRELGQRNLILEDEDCVEYHRNSERSV